MTAKQPKQVASHKGDFRPTQLWIEWSSFENAKILIDLVGRIDLELEQYSSKPCITHIATFNH